MTLVVEREPETRAFAIVQLAGIFQNANIRVRIVEMPPGHVFPMGNGVVMYRPGVEPLSKNDIKDDPLFIALESANLFGGYTTKPLSSLDISFNEHVPLLDGGEHIVYVGRKDTR